MAKTPKGPTPEVPESSTIASRVLVNPYLPVARLGPSRPTRILPTLRGYLRLLTSRVRVRAEFMTAGSQSPVSTVLHAIPQHAVGYASCVLPDPCIARSLHRPCDARTKHSIHGYDSETTYFPLIPARPLLRPAVYDAVEDFPPRLPHLAMCFVKFLRMGKSPRAYPLTFQKRTPQNVLGGPEQPPPANLRRFYSRPPFASAPMSS